MTICLVKGCCETAKLTYSLISGDISICDEHIDAAGAIVGAAKSASGEIVNQALQDIRALGSKRGMAPVK